MKNEVLKDIKNKVIKLDDSKKNNLIKNITNKNNWYYDMNIDNVLDILITIGYDKKSAVEVYKLLITS